MKAYYGCGGTDPHILNFGSFTSGTHKTGG